MPVKCLLCEYEAERYGLGSLEMRCRYVCPNCGTFLVTSLYERTFNGLQKHLISGYVREKYDNDEEAYITTENVGSIMDSPLIPRSPIEKLDKLLLWYYKKSDSFGKLIKVSPYPAICYAVDKVELDGLYSHAVEHKHFLLLHNDLPQIDEDQYILVPMETHQYCRELLNNGHVSNTAFVAMWFAKELDDAYNNAIIPALEEDCKFKAVRVDNIEHNNDITDEIIAGIKESRFVIADMTGYRGGVYYEAGYARGLEKPVIFTCRKDWFEGEIRDGAVIKERVHFDINHLNIIVWEKGKEKELRKRITDRIRATIL